MAAAAAVYAHVSALCDAHAPQLDELGFVHDLPEAAVFEGSKLAIPYGHVTLLLREAEQRWQRARGEAALAESRGCVQREREKERENKPHFVSVSLFLSFSAALRPPHHCPLFYPQKKLLRPSLPKRKKKRARGRTLGLT